MKFACVVMVICIMVVLSAPMTEATMIRCRQVAAALLPCYTHLLGGLGPSSSCCSGVRRLNDATRSLSNRRVACNCMKKAVSFVLGFNQANAEALPGKCGVYIPYKISTSINCASLKI